MKAFHKALMMVLGTVMMAAAPAMADQPSYVRVRSISYAGSGCPAGSVSQSISPDQSSVTLMWDNFVAQVGPGQSLSQSRKNCQIALDLDFPSGWSYSVVRTRSSGFVTLDPGVTATLTASYYFQGQMATARLSSNIYGPTSRDYQVDDVLGLSTRVWSPCGSQRALNINVAARLSAANRNARGMISLDSPLGGTLGSLQLQWQRCR